MQWIRIQTLTRDTSMLQNDLKQAAMTDVDEREKEAANEGEPEVDGSHGNRVNLSDKKKKVGNYLLGKTVGEGTFAKVRQGFHLIAREKVAVKVVPKKVLQLRDNIKRNVRREAVMLQRLHHPNIVRLLEVMETPNTYYLVLEYAEGGEFIRYLSKRKYLSEEESQAFTRQLSSALCHMHQRHIVHRDIKLDNFLLDKDYNIKIIDFGLSNAYHRDSSLSTQCGSPAYAAPEIFSNQKYGSGVDVWSLGVCVYAMLIGCLPFVPQPINNLAQLHALILKGCTFPSDLSPEAKALLKRMLEVDRNQRITAEKILSHAWLNSGHHMTQPEPENDSDVSEPDPNILRFMAKMSKCSESEVITSLQEKKVNGLAATYHLLHRRFNSGLKFVEIPPENGVLRRERSMPVSSECSHPTPESGKINTGLSTPLINPNSYKSYVQSLKENRTRPKLQPEVAANDVFLQRHKIIATIKPESSVTQRSLANGRFKQFNLPYTPTCEQLYAWAGGSLVRLADKKVQDETNSPTAEVVDRKDSSVTNSDDHGEVSGPRQSEQSRDEGAADDMSEVSIRLPAGSPSPPPRAPTAPQIVSPSYWRFQQANKRFLKRSQSERQQRAPRENEGLSITGTETSESQESLSVSSNNKRKAKLVKGVTLTLSKAKTIFAFPFSTSKPITPRGYRHMPSLEDLRQAQIVGKGRIMVERSKSYSVDFRKPKTAGSCKGSLMFPDVAATLRLNERSKSDMGLYLTPDDKTSLPEVVLSDKPSTPERASSPVEKIIADDEAPMMRIRITSFAKQ